jgi:hypothetical protein
MVGYLSRWPSIDWPETRATIEIAGLSAIGNISARNFRIAGDTARTVLEAWF